MLKPSALQSILLVFSVFVIVVLLSKPRPLTLTQSESLIYKDALNSTLGFHRIYTIVNPNDQSMRNIQAVSQLLGVPMTLINSTSAEKAKDLQEKHGYLASLPDIIELTTHQKIYRNIVEENIQSAVILGPNIDMELHIQHLLSQALSDIGLSDIIFISRSYSEPNEPYSSELLEVLKLDNSGFGSESNDLSFEQRKYWARKRFLSKPPSAFRSRYPQGGSLAYVINKRTAGRLDRRLGRRMQMDEHNLDFILADMAMVGLSVAWSLSPPLVTRVNEQWLGESVLHAISLRNDDPVKYAPYVDWKEIW